MLNYCYCDSHLTECAVELFGNNCYKNCSLTCGNPVVCYKVTGHCNGRCLPGWEGDMCQKGNILYKIMFITLRYPYFDIYALLVFFYILNCPMTSFIVHVKNTFKCIPFRVFSRDLRN